MRGVLADVVRRAPRSLALNSIGSGQQQLSRIVVRPLTNTASSDAKQKPLVLASLSSLGPRHLSSSSSNKSTGVIHPDPIEKKEVTKGGLEAVTIPLLTLNYHPLGEITKIHGLVTSSSVRNKNILIDMWCAAVGVLGGNTPSYEDLVNESVVAAANGLAEAAHAVGATHVIDVHIEQSAIITRFVIGTHFFVTATGMAVTIKMRDPKR